MRHHKDGRQFGRNTSHRRAMFRALTANLVLHERIETTDAKAKELRRFADHIITHARRLGAVAYTPHDKLKPAEQARRLAAVRQVGRFLQRFAVKSAAGNSERVDLLEKVFVDLAQRFRERAGGYTRIIKLGSRRGDNAPMSRVEFVEGAPPLVEKPQEAVKVEQKKPAEEAKAAEKTQAEKPVAVKAAAKSAPKAEKPDEPAKPAKKPRKKATET